MNIHSGHSTSTFRETVGNLQPGDYPISPLFRGRGYDQIRCVGNSTIARLMIFVKRLSVIVGMRLLVSRVKVPPLK